MSVIQVLTYLDEAGDPYSPPELTFQLTSCTSETGKKIKKTYQVVFIHDDGEGGWIEDPVFVPDQSIAVLKVTNPCTDDFSYLGINQNDYRLAQQCCTPVEISAEIDSENFSSGENEINAFLGCGEGSLISVINITGSSVDAILIQIAAYLNLTYPELGFFYVDGGTISLLSANTEVFDCVSPIFNFVIVQVV